MALVIRIITGKETGPRLLFAAFVLALFFLAPPFLKTSCAVETVALGALLEEAKANNPELKALREKASAKEARVEAEGALDDPTLKVEMMDLSKDHPFNISPGNAMQTKYMISQMLPFPGKLSLKEKMALKEAYAAMAAFRSKDLDIAARVKEAYFDYAYLVDSIRITEEIKTLLANMSRIAESKYSVGQGSQHDVIKVNVESAMLTNELITLGAEKSVAAARIKSFLNRDQSSPIGEPEGLPGERVEFRTEDLIETAIRTNPEIKMAELDMEAGELGADLARKNYYPDFMVGAGPVQRDGRFDSFDVMFQINIPLWRGKYDSRAEEAVLNAVSLRSRLASGKNDKVFEVKGASIQVDAADRMRTLYETSLLPQVELSFESALKNYRAGKIDFLTLLDTERELKKTRIEYLKTILEYRKRVAALEKAVGEDLKTASSGAVYKNGALLKEDDR